MQPTASAVKEFVKFIEARERHRKAKEGGAWQTRAPRDPIIDQYRFCNVRRNDDRVTKWIHSNYLNLWREDKMLWFALAVARLFNNEPTLTAIASTVVPFKPEKMRGILQSRALLGEKNFNAAYIVSTNGRSMDKVDYVIDHVLTPLWEGRAHMAHEIGKQELLSVVHEKLAEANGLASFMAAQIVADLKYADPNRWSDFHEFCASGPGSKRGLNRVLGRDLATPWREDDFRSTVRALRDMTNARLPWEPLTAQDIQNCLCEYDKYERARTGEGRPKQIYKPKES